MIIRNELEQQDNNDNNDINEISNIENITSINNSPTIQYSSLASRNTSGGVIFAPPRNRYKPSFIPGIELPKYPLGDWAPWSMFPHTIDELRQRLITKPIDQTCISYVCRYSRISPEFFEEFAVLASGLFHNPGNTDNEFIAMQPITYSKESVNYFISVYRHKCDKKEKIIEVPECIREDEKYFRAFLKTVHRDKTFPSIKDIPDRIDWFYIKQHQKWPGWLVARYYKQFEALQKYMLRPPEEEEP